jgi:hypothetical protein
LKFRFEAAKPAAPLKHKENHAPPCFTVVAAAVVVVVEVIAVVVAVLVLGRLRDWERKHNACTTDTIRALMHSVSLCLSLSLSLSPSLSFSPNLFPTISLYSTFLHSNIFYSTLLYSEAEADVESTGRDRGTGIGIDRERLIVM